MSQFPMKVFPILILTRFNSAHFSVNSSVIFTRLIFGLCSIKSGQRSLKNSLPTLRVLINFLGYTCLNLTNLLINFLGLSRLNLGWFFNMREVSKDLKRYYMHSHHCRMPLLFLSKGQKLPVLLIYFLENHNDCCVLCYACSEMLLI